MASVPDQPLPATIQTCGWRWSSGLRGASMNILDTPREPHIDHSDYLPVPMCPALGAVVLSVVFGTVPVASGQIEASQVANESSEAKASCRTIALGPHA